MGTQRARAGDQRRARRRLRRRLRLRRHRSHRRGALAVLRQEAHLPRGDVLGRADRRAARYRGAQGDAHTTGGFAAARGGLVRDL